MKRTATPEQIEATKARRSALAALAGNIAAMSPQDRATLASKSSIMTIEGRSLSVFNQCLLVSQNPFATVVGGFAQWKAAGRIVRKGEHGLALWVPCKGKETLNAGLAVIAGSNVAEKTRFLMGTVFDVSQTDPLVTEDEVEAIRREFGYPALPPGRPVELEDFAPGAFKFEGMVGYVGHVTPVGIEARS